MPNPDFQVHPTAIVEEGALIGTDTRIWHHCHIRKGAQIGSRCNLGKNVYLDSGAIVGNGVKIQNNVSVYVGVTIADDVFVGPSAVFTNDRVPRAFNDEWQVTPTTLQRGASVGANATIVCGNAIGEFAMIAAGSVVTRDVEPHQLVAGNPARHLGWVCRCGNLLTRDAQKPPELMCPSCVDMA